jgi:hypothetical protein
MTNTQFWLLISITVLMAIYLIARLNTYWIYHLFDHALTNGRGSIDTAYERPRYFRVDAHGTLDKKKRWPGWDGWYFFMIPDIGQLPLKMVRASIMTGLYGLNGIDDYALLPSGIGPFHAVEHLTMTLVDDEDDHETLNSTENAPRSNRLLHFYAPKDCLTMDPQILRVEIRTTGNDRSMGSGYSGTIHGAWPEYHFAFHDSAWGQEITLKYVAKDIIWWADVRGVFTYFSSFGQFVGTIKYSFPADDSSSQNPPKYVTRPISGAGAFEHGFARKPFSFDSAYVPVRALQTILPEFRPVQYHYQLLLGDDGFHGGFMYASAFGIEFRNRGGFYLRGRYIPIECVKIQYTETREVHPGAPNPNRSMKFPKAWTVSAETAEGRLQINVISGWPPARITSNMIYYHYSFEATYQGEKIRGSGYGEYLSL